MIVKVEIYPQGERLDCSISQAGTMVGEWNGEFTFHQEGIFQPSNEYKSVNTCFKSLLHKFHD